MHGRLLALHWWLLWELVLRRPGAVRRSLEVHVAVGLSHIVLDKIRVRR